MKLPGAERVIVDERKVREYLLSPSHPIGRFKAAFFARAGFRAENWQEFVAALRDLAVRGEAVQGEASKYGEK